MSRPFSSQRGQAMTEFVIIATFVTLVLFIGEPSLLDRLLAAIQDRYGRFTFAIALP